MGRNRCGCGGVGRRGSLLLRALGLLLIGIGCVLLLISLPFRFWVALLGLLIALLGFMLWRFN